jgi:hypothetical protein
MERFGLTAIPLFTRFRVKIDKKFNDTHLASKLCGALYNLNSGTNAIVEGDGKTTTVLLNAPDIEHCESYVYSALNYIEEIGIDFS